MRKLLTVVIVLLAAGLASFLWVRSQMGITDPARLMPPETVAFAAVPDIPRALLRWPGTALARIGAEPEVAAFLEKPLGFFGKERGGDEAARLLGALKPGRIFAAIVPGEQAPRALLGFQFWGSRKDFETAIARLRAEISEAPLPEPTVEKEGEAQFLSAATKQGRIYWGASGRWGFVANDRAALAGSLDRAAGRLMAASSLAGNADFQACREALAAEPDLVVFVRPGPVLDAVIEAGAIMGFEPNAAQVQGLRRAVAAAYGLRAEGAALKERLFVLRPDPPDLGSLAHLGLPFSNPGTLAYFDALMRVESLGLALAGGLPGSNFGGALGGMADRLPDALDGRFSLVINWAADSPRPEAFGFFGVKDRAAARELLLAAATGHLPEISVSSAGEREFFSFPTLRSPFFDPLIALEDRMLVAALDGGSLRTLLGEPPHTTLESSPAFAPALPSFHAANESFGFIDLRALFERAYPLGRQILAFSAALVPGLSDVMDPSKLPQTETIARHLSPVIFSQTRRADGYLLESSGPVTMLQAMALGSGSAAGFLGSSQPGP